MDNNLKSLRILFISICLVYIFRAIRAVFVIIENINDKLYYSEMEHFVVAAKTILIIGISLSFYMRIKSSNGHIHQQIENSRLTEELFHNEAASIFEREQTENNSCSERSLQPTPIT